MNKHILQLIIDKYSMDKSDPADQIFLLQKEKKWNTKRMFLVKRKRWLSLSPVGVRWNMQMCGPSAEGGFHP